MVAIGLLAIYTEGIAAHVYGLRVKGAYWASSQPACASAGSSMRR
jgi:hypothetical protein